MVDTLVYYQAMEYDTRVNHREISSVGSGKEGTGKHKVNRVEVTG